MGDQLRSRLPLRYYYRGLEASNETEELLEEVMTRLDADDRDEALKAALQAFLKQIPPKHEAP